jgi:hypothetical protein
VPSLLVRDVPEGDLEVLRAAAAANGRSLQAYMLDAVHAQAVHARRQDALKRASARLEGEPPVSDAARQAVLDAIEAAHGERAGELARDR